MSTSMKGMLRHEHVVRINDPADPRAGWLTRRQLWEGLRHTVMAPQALDASIDAASVRELSPGTLIREIRRGHATLADQVQIASDESLRISADAGGAFCGSSLTIRIEEPEPQMLVVRFTYEILGLEEVRDEEEDQARRSAYECSDLDRIEAVRRHARSH